MHRSISFVGLLVYSIVGFRRFKKAGQRGQYAPAHNPAAPAPFGQSLQYQGASPYQQNTTYNPQAGGPMELHNNCLPPYQNDPASGYYQQPVKPVHMV